MSSKEFKILEKKDFIKRFVEVCGTKEPVEVSRILNISYQAARNYLNGRLPESNILLNIAEKTPYSLHWLLTGRGEKFIEIVENAEETNLLAKMREIVKEECVTAIQETFGENPHMLLPKSVILKKADVRSEKSRKENS